MCLLQVLRPWWTILWFSGDPEITIYGTYKAANTRCQNLAFSDLYRVQSGKEETLPSPRSQLHPVSGTIRSVQAELAACLGGNPLPLYCIVAFGTRSFHHSTGLRPLCWRYASPGHWHDTDETRGGFSRFRRRLLYLMMVLVNDTHCPTMIDRLFAAAAPRSTWLTPIALHPCAHPLERFTHLI